MITLKQAIMVAMMLTLSLSLMAGCSGSSSPRMVNELTFGLAGVNEVAISYDEETLTFYASDDGDLTVREYMTADKNSYYANVTEKDGAIHISEGGKPLNRSGFERYVEVYIPVSYAGALNITSTSGNINLTGLDVAVGAFHADTTSGIIEIGAVTADRVRLTTTSGEIDCDTLSGTTYLETKSGTISVQSANATGGVFETHTTSGTFALGNVAADQVVFKCISGSVECGEVSGQINYTTTSGDLTIKSATGSGSFDASNSGNITVAFAQVSGNLSLFNKNGGIDLTLPPDVSFHFQGTTRNGSIDTNFGSDLQKDGDSLAGDVGGVPSVTVTLETREGDITVTR